MKEPDKLKELHNLMEKRPELFDDKDCSSIDDINKCGDEYFESLGEWAIKRLAEAEKEEEIRKKG